MVRKIREKQAKEIENKSREEIIAYFRSKAKKLHEKMKTAHKVGHSK